MRKRILLGLSLLAVIFVANAQSDDIEPVILQGKNAFYVGPKIGLTLTSMGQPEGCNLYDGSGLGFSGGVAGKIRFGKATPNSPAGTGLLGIGLELKYKQNTVKTLGFDEDGKENAKLSIGYFEVPLSVQLYPFAKVSSLNTLYIEVGPSIAGTMSKKPKSLQVNNPSPEWEYIKYKTEDLKGFDVRVLAGLGYTIPGTGLDINARYYLGTSKLAKNFSSKMNTFEVSLSWMFNVGSF